MIEIFDDIKKLYHFHNPCGALKNHIEFISETSIDQTEKFVSGSSFTIKMFPAWTPTIWINLGPHYHLAIGDQKYFVPSGKGVVVTRDLITERINQCTDYLFSIKFYPGSFESIVGIDPLKLKNDVTDLTKFLPAPFIEQIKNANTFEERIKLTEGFFIKSAETVKHTDHYLSLVQKTIATYTSCQMKYNVNELSEKLFTTSKTINRYFQKVIGTTPKNYFSFLRARIALTGYLDNKKGFSPAEFGYCDMSHFYKDVIKLTGQRLVELHT